MMRFFANLLELAVALTPVLALLLLLLPGPGRRYSARARCAVWMVVALRLLVPLNVGPDQTLLRIDLGGSRGEAGSETAPAQSDELWRAAELLTDTLQRADLPAGGVLNPAGAVDPAALRELEVAQPAAGRNPAALLLGIWLAGAAGYGLYLLLTHLGAMRALRRWSTPVRDEKLLALLESAKASQNVQRRVGLFRSGRVSGPMLVGLFRPRILLPESDGEGENALEMVLGHELCHLRRGDLWRKLALLAVGALYWFHPLVHLMRRQAEWDIEMACDEGVLSGANAQLRREYGFAVLAVLEGRAERAIPLSTRFGGGRQQMLRRFGQMVDPSPKRRGALPVALVLAAVVVCGALVGCTLPGGEAEPVEAAVPADRPEMPESDEPLAAEAVEVEAEEVEAEEVEAADPAAMWTDIDPGELYESMESLFLEDIEASGTMAELAQVEILELARTLQWNLEPYEGDNQFVWPLPGYYNISSEYGPRFGGADNHTGMDLTGSGVYGAAVVAAEAGEVRFVNRDYTPGLGYGIYLILDHGGGLSTLYAQLSDVVVEVGDRVEAGQKIAEVGSTGFSTGPHLHVEVWVNGAHTDPRPYIIGGDAEEPEPDRVGFVLPVDGSYPFDMAGDGGGGVWFTLERGGAVRAGGAGTVLAVREDYGELGNCIVVDHGNGFATLYAGLGEMQARVGDEVEAGQVFAQPGAATEDRLGQQLYFAVYYNGQVRVATDYFGALLD